MYDRAVSCRFRVLVCIVFYFWGKQISIRHWAGSGPTSSLRIIIVDRLRSTNNHTGVSVIWTPPKLVKKVTLKFGTGKTILRLKCSEVSKLGKNFVGIFSKFRVQLRGFVTKI